MGLASKLAAAQGGTAAVANYATPRPPQGQPGQQQPQGQPPSQSAYPGQQQYQPYSGGAPGYSQGQNNYNRPPPAPPRPGQQSSSQYQAYSTPPPQQSYGQPPYPQQQGPPGSYGYGYGGQPPQQQQYGGPPPQQQQQYGRPPPPQQQYGGPGGPPGGGFGHAGDIASYQRELERAVQEKGLQAFYGPGTRGAQRIPQLAQRAVQEVDRLCQAWRIQKEIANDVVRLALYDVIIYIDDSGSMSFEENGERIKDLRLILQRTAFAATLFDVDGIEIRFMNDESIPPNLLSGIRDEQQIENIMERKRFNGVTPFGTKLREKVLDPLVVSKMRNRSMEKPVLVIGITDGQPSGESANALTEAVRYAYHEAQRSSYGPGAIDFQFAQVGNDQKATEFLAKLDNDPEVGGLVDCTSNYENESAEMARANPPIDLTPDLWMMKLILGAIDPSYDTKDEKRNMAGSMPPPQAGGYGGGAPQYGQQPQQGYGGGQQYGQQSQPAYNRPPPPGPPGQQGGGYGGGYGGQQGGYGGGQQGGYGQQQGGGYGGGYGGGAPPPPRY